ncbi:hypothetical protein LPC08_13115 [Roseomonas sp. OT10]|uniref:hypothetical protein n=1 Tax=Roseomonas cutis TaxID=2897332 RepID=UPI001E529B2F|nr:hypothetical protein [Roseomonas sp. OT10]UFN46969.1 hypothetical protein LPC08_13115 [Roseomonas sp. OT10]
MDALPRPRPLPEDPDEARAAAEIAAWLAAHPRFLAENPSLYRAQEPPRRVHGERLADHMAAMLAAERTAAAEAAHRVRRAAQLATRVQRAVLALLAAADPQEAITQEWPALLALETVVLAREGPPAPRWRALPAGAVARLLPPGRDWRLRDAPGAGDAAPLHGEAAALIARDALLRLPSRGGGARLLVLGARDPGRLPLRGGGAGLLFLAQAAAAALARP